MPEIKIATERQMKKKYQRTNRKKKWASHVQAPLPQLIALILFRPLSSTRTFSGRNVWQSSASSFVRIHSAGRAPNLCWQQICPGEKGLSQ